MTVRPAIAADLGKHLSAEIEELLKRHAAVAEAGGVTFVEWSAAVMTAIDRLIVHGLAGVVIQSERAKRGELLDVAMLKLASEMYRRRDELLQVADLTDAIVAKVWGKRRA